jgi:O-methyltransferase involved in polyketide biosynthesis
MENVEKSKYLTKEEAERFITFIKKDLKINKSIFTKVIGDYKTFLTYKNQIKKGTFLRSNVAKFLNTQESDRFAKVRDLF